DGRMTPWLGMPIAEFPNLKHVFLIGSFLRKDHPLLAARVRQAVKRGAKISIMHAVDDELLMPIANKMIKAPSAWLSALAEVAVAIAQKKGIAAPSGPENVQPSSAAQQTAEGLLSGEPSGVFLGNAVAQHPQASQLHAMAQWIAQNTNAHFGYLTEAANTVGGYVANATPGKDGANAMQMLEQPRKAYLLLHVEPELDCFDPQLARAALQQADMVVVMSPFKHGMEYADVLLPIAPFSETSGTFINAEGRVQSFNGSAKPLGETRPAWKALRVLGNLLELPGFDYESSEVIRDQVLNSAVDLDATLDNICDLQPQAPGSAADAGEQIERVADVPIYFSDGIVRRAKALQLTNDAKPPKAWLSKELAEKIGVTSGMPVLVKQGDGSTTLEAEVDPHLPANVVRVATAHSSTAMLGAMFGSITVEKA
ncbi:MAG TPA: molybdopterin-dependent oxidoreductase, partial [Burkholderiaceae bacterium]|nr:molybdopterin-dependent oxidoreductase [Burkholderiaceae bacterium]